MYPETFSERFTIGVGEADCFGRLRLASLQHFVQETSIGHINALGASRKKLLELVNGVWMLARIELVLNTVPVYGDILELTTWSPQISGVSFERELSISVVNNDVVENIGYVSSLWMVVDINTRKILRAERICKSINFHPINTRKYPSVKKPRVFETLTPIFSHQINYSDLDLNRHVNNCRYPDFICDALRFEEREDVTPSRILITYTSESVSGDTLTILSSEKEDYAIIRGVNQSGAVKFDAILGWKNNRGETDV